MPHDFKIFKAYKADWRVFYFDFTNQLAPFNIFNSASFCSLIYPLMIKSGVPKDQFEIDLRRFCIASFGHKTEYEIIISNWPSQKVSRKIDVYKQLVLNWDRFLKYMWNLHKKMIE